MKYHAMIGRINYLTVEADNDNQARAIRYKYQAADFAAFTAELTAWRYFRGGEK
jgi:hypothetical protein